MCTKTFPVFHREMPFQWVFLTLILFSPPLTVFVWSSYYFSPLLKLQISLNFLEKKFVAFGAGKRKAEENIHPLLPLRTRMRLRYSMPFLLIYSQNSFPQGTQVHEPEYRDGKQNKHHIIQEEGMTCYSSWTVTRNLADSSASSISSPGQLEKPRVTGGLSTWLPPEGRIQGATNLSAWAWYWWRLWGGSSWAQSHRVCGTAMESGLDNCC